MHSSHAVGCVGVLVALYSQDELPGVGSVPPGPQLLLQLLQLLADSSYAVLGCIHLSLHAHGCMVEGAALLDVVNPLWPHTTGRCRPMVVTINSNTQ
jgi:hypothetical protein